MPFHQKRVWQITDEPSAPELADKLAHRTWTLCTGFRHNGYLFLNDSTTEDAAQEYAVIKEATGQQVESLTVSWMTHPQVLAHISCASKGEYDDLDLGTLDIAGRCQPPAVHKRCALCA